MTLNGVKAGDLVECDVLGLRFVARVEEVGAVGAELARGRYRIEAVCNSDARRISYKHVTARQVIGHYRRAAGSR